MTNIETLDYDVVVVGAGAAGLRAAIEASAEGARTAIACKSLLGKAGTAMEREGVACATQEGAERVAELQSWGALFDRAPNGLIAQRGRARLAHRDDRTGLEVLRALQHEAVRRGIDVHMECAVHRLLVEEGRVVGAFGLRRASGGFVHFRCGAAVLATGGSERAWREDACADATGDGHLLALEARGAAGLYAAGDVLGEKGLAAALVFGRRAGLHAARFSLGARGRVIVGGRRLEEIVRELLAPLERTSGENPYAILAALRACLQRDDMEEIGRLKQRALNASAPGPRTWNPAWHLALELRSMIAVAEAAVRAKPGGWKRFIDWGRPWRARKPRFASGAATPAAARSKTIG